MHISDTRVLIESMDTKYSMHIASFPRKMSNIKYTCKNALCKRRDKEKRKKRNYMCKMIRRLKRNDFNIYSSYTNVTNECDNDYVDIDHRLGISHTSYCIIYYTLLFSWEVLNTAICYSRANFLSLRHNLCLYRENLLHAPSTFTPKFT